MKKLVLSITAITTLMACTQTSKKEIGIVLSGEIANTKAENNMYLYDGNNTVLDSIALENGKFSDTLDLANGHYMLAMAKSRLGNLYLEKGNVIHIQADLKDKKAFTISGKGAAASNYILQKSNLRDSLYGKGSGIYTLEEKEYVDKITTAKSTLETLLQEQDSVSEPFKALEKRNLHFDYLRYISRYERYHAHYAQKKDFKASASFDSELDAVDYANEEDYNFSSSYRGLVQGHFIKQGIALREKDSTIARDIAFLKAVSSLENENIKNKLVFDEAKYGITYTEDVESYFTAFKAVATDSSSIAQITEKYEKLKKLKAGNISPKFVSYENFAGGTTSLEDFKGKYVYIDVWATWCGPCLAEIPSLKKLEADYHNKNIAFLSISVDNENAHDAWKKMVADRELTGVQLYADNSFDSEFIQNYMIVAIPRFILIDPEGTIISANAARPSSDKIRTQFNEIL